MLTFSCGTQEKEGGQVVASSDYNDRPGLSKEFREFVKPKVIDGIPDYTAAAMEEQRRGIKKFQSRLAAIDISRWPVSQQVYYHLVRADMNTLDFYHRVLHPWSHNPGFYLISQAVKGPTIYGKWRVPRRLPLPVEDISELRMKLKTVPEILKQARGNLTEGSMDLALIAIWAMELDGFTDNEYAIFRDLASRLAEHHPEKENRQFPHNALNIS
jgi:hypothetical protein